MFNSACLVLLMMVEMTMGPSGTDGEMHLIPFLCVSKPEWPLPLYGPLMFRTVEENTANTYIDGEHNSCSISFFFFFVLNFLFGPRAILWSHCFGLLVSFLMGFKSRVDISPALFLSCVLWSWRSQLVWHLPFPLIGVYTVSACMRHGWPGSSHMHWDLNHQYSGELLSSAWLSQMHYRLSYSAGHSIWFLIIWFSKQKFCNYAFCQFIWIRGYNERVLKMWGTFSQCLVVIYLINQYILFLSSILYFTILSTLFVQWLYKWLFSPLLYQCTVTLATLFNF